MFRIAKINDTDAILDYLHASWRGNHPYVRHPDLFLFDFQNGSDLNIGVLEYGGKIQGIFGYFLYNSSETPDIGGMLWSVNSKVQKAIPLAGIRLRSFIMGSVPHRFFGSPGASRGTKAIYEKLGKVWKPLEHYVGTDRETRWPDFISIKGGILKNQTCRCTVRAICDARNDRQFSDEIFQSQTPTKDRNFLERRYLKNPFRKYDLWCIYTSDNQLIVVTRKLRVKDCEILRVVDVIGCPTLAANAISAVYFAYKSKPAYIDFVACGFSANAFKELGFASVDFKNDRVVVPNYFEPFEKRSVQLFANYDPGFPATTMVRGNGDQDRPNILNAS